MKNQTLVAGLALLLGGPLSAQQPTIREVTLQSEELNQTRELLIFEPMNYRDNPHVYFDVIYVFDAQTRSLFDYASAVANLSKDGEQGAIVVGIKATFDLERMYGRNHDLIPSDSKWRLGPTPPNAEGFLAYVKNEVVPFVESNYRVLPHRTAIGHSLSASFLVYALLNETEFFDNYIAVSPNMEYDDQRLVRGLRDFDSGQFTTPTFFYMSHADEGTGTEWPRWPEANANAYTVLRDSLANDNFRVVVEQYPEENHMSGYMPSVTSALGTYFREIRPIQISELSEEEYRVTFTVQVPNEEDEIYIFGNQESLGSEESGGVRMERVAPRVRQITLRVRDHVEMRFFRGAGDAQARIKFGANGWTTYPVMVRPEEGAEYTFEVVGYSN